MKVIKHESEIPDMVFDPRKSDTFSEADGEDKPSLVTEYQLGMKTSSGLSKEYN